MSGDDDDPPLVAATPVDPIILCMLVLSYDELSEYIAHGQATIYAN